MGKKEQQLCVVKKETSTEKENRGEERDTEWYNLDGIISCPFHFPSFGVFNYSCTVFLSTFQSH